MDDNMITTEGSWDAVVSIVSQKTQLSSEIVEAVLSILFDNPSLLENDEDVSVEEVDDNVTFGAAGLMAGNGKVYINLRKIVIYSCVLLLNATAVMYSHADIPELEKLLPTFMCGLADEIHNNGLEHLIIFPEENNGEKCILMEAMKLRKTHRSFTAQTIKRELGNKCDKSYNCMYKKSRTFSTTYKCGCMTENVQCILELLKGKETITGDEAGYNYIV